MIPYLNIIAWGQVVPWGTQRQVEQDLIICRALVALFSDTFLQKELRFRGGTALNKLHFPAPLRYSEDIDLVRTTSGPIKPVIDRIRDVLEPWLGKPGYDSSPVAPKLRFRVPAEDGSGTIRLKIEINTWEIEAFDPPAQIPFRIGNPWFTGEASITTFSREELMATKLRALLQRDKGRDLYDLGHALEVFHGLNLDRMVECLGLYLAKGKLDISRAEAERRMFAKYANPTFLTDMRPLLAANEAQNLDETATKRIFERVFTEVITRIPGKPWARSDEMKRTLGVLL
ncbi:nucleotidyl transferase AbiEii/AbiGii toxin family protein [Geminisphaera colitermitum]|uniref:nucleotidyl transferase AbiEii/AbiGii toxin family protein n=1 Tax=Geminisphaera colitermitum TaxID=1148786 RepID=UPI0001964F0F|nr:nucleotidyl transferase AbiEii/AbiGii toxin family protein [Geminisphaera colitermitum]